MPDMTDLETGALTNHSWAVNTARQAAESLRRRYEASTGRDGLQGLEDMAALAIKQAIQNTFHRCNALALEVAKRFDGGSAKKEHRDKAKGAREAARAILEGV